MFKCLKNFAKYKKSIKNSIKFNIFDRSSLLISITKLAYPQLRQMFCIILAKTCYKMHKEKLLAIVESFKTIIFKI